MPKFTAMSRCRAFSAAGDYANPSGIEKCESCVDLVIASSDCSSYRSAPEETTCGHKLKMVTCSLKGQNLCREDCYKSILSSCRTRSVASLRQSLWWPSCDRFPSKDKNKLCQSRLRNRAKIESYSKTCYSSSTSYSGRIAVSTDGQPCLPWATQNVCSPREVSWCVVSSGATRHRFCTVKECSDKDVVLPKFTTTTTASTTTSASSTSALIGEQMVMYSTATSLTTSTTSTSTVGAANAPGNVFVLLALVILVTLIGITISCVRHIGDRDAWIEMLIARTRFIIQFAQHLAKPIPHLDDFDTSEDFRVRSGSQMTNISWCSNSTNYSTLSDGWLPLTVYNDVHWLNTKFTTNQHNDDDIQINPNLISNAAYMSVKRKSTSPSPDVQIRCSNFSTIKHLSRGHQGEVYLTRTTNSQLPIVIKTFRQSKTDLNYSYVSQEITALRRLGTHSNIISLLGVGQLDGADTQLIDRLAFCSDSTPDTSAVRLQTKCLLLEYAPMGDLATMLREKRKKVTNGDRLRFCVQIASAVSYISHKHMIHRDIALRNCLVDANMHVKLCDFSLSSPCFPRAHLIGDWSERLPSYWLAPECHIDRRFSHFSDVWAMGITIWEVYADAIRPYIGMSCLEVIEMLTKTSRRLSKPEGTPDTVFDLIARCWITNASERPTANSIHKSLMIEYENKTKKCKTVVRIEIVSESEQL